MASIAIHGLSKSYGGAGDMAAVSDLTLDIADNEFVTLLGPSGCGKTTTLRLIAGFIAPDTGTIHAGGRLVSTRERVVPPEERGMGMVFQNYAVWPHKTVFENVVFGLKLRGLSSADARARVRDTLALVNLTGFEDRLPSALSGGQQQRVALARSLVVEPGILLLDEPLSNLDAKLRERMRGELKELQRRTGITFVYVTHDQAEAMALADRIAVMQGGKLQQFGTPQEVYARPASRAVADFMGLVNFLTATVVAAEHPRGRLRIGSGWTLEAGLPAALSPGDTVEIAVRPENVHLKPRAGAAQADLAATVTERTFLGSAIEYHVALEDGTALRTQAHPLDEFATGETVAVAINASHCTVFAVDSESTPVATTIDRENQGASA
jgi:iron(III) transport system ATP-binding protein